MHDWFADEIAIDFPSVTPAVERMRDAFLGVANDGVLQAELSLSPREASDGHVVPLEVPVRSTCPRCGGRGESWTERCHVCCGTGDAEFRHTVRVSVPPGVAVAKPAALANVYHWPAKSVFGDRHKPRITWTCSSSRATRSATPAGQSKP